MNKFLKKAEGFVTSRGFSAGVVTALVIALVIVANVIIYTLTSLFNLSLTAPIERDYGISGVTDEMFAAAEDADMNGYIVTTGPIVLPGQVIGYCGATGVATGVHLHFSIYKDGKTVDPADYIEI